MNFLRSRGFLTALVLLGVALRLWAYAGNPSLWLDEILLSRNILELPLRTLLTQPLELDQVAPRGFLLVEKVAVLVFGGHELALRLFPFLSGIAGVFLFRRVAERSLDGLAVPFAVALFAIGIPFIKYGAEVKQYEIDATVAILLLLLASVRSERHDSPPRGERRCRSGAADADRSATGLSPLGATVATRPGLLTARVLPTGAAPWTPGTALAIETSCSREPPSR